MKIFGKSGVFASTGSRSWPGGTASESGVGGAAGTVVEPAAEGAPTLEDLKAQLCLVAQGLRKLYGNRAAVIIAIGLPNGDHDRFAAYTTGPCLMERGLLHWAVPNLVEQMDAHVTEGDKP